MEDVVANWENSDVGPLSCRRQFHSLKFTGIFEFPDQGKFLLRMPLPQEEGRQSETQELCYSSLREELRGKMLRILNAQSPARPDLASLTGQENLRICFYSITSSHETRDRLIVVWKMWLQIGRIQMLGLLSWRKQFHSLKIAGIFEFPDRGKFLLLMSLSQVEGRRSETQELCYSSPREKLRGKMLRILNAQSPALPDLASLTGQENRRICFYSITSSLRLRIVRSAPKSPPRIRRAPVFLLSPN